MHAWLFVSAPSTAYLNSKKEMTIEVSMDQFLGTRDDRDNCADIAMELRSDGINERCMERKPIKDTERLNERWIMEGV